MLAGKMSPLEWRSVISLSTIMALRMLGLFIVLPVFSLYASQLNSATPFLLGVALGIYGLFQAICQIPLGVLSDRFGRKPIIAAGLIVFVIGSLLASFAHSIFFLMLGRSLQGMAAIGGTLLATLSDLTTDNHRTQAMAIAGITIGISFSLAMFLGPVLVKWLTVPHLFSLSALFGIMGIIILYISVPTPVRLFKNSDTPLTGFFAILRRPELVRLNVGIFLLHLLFTASFVAIPLSLSTYADLKSQWQFYLPTFFLAFIACLLLIRQAERRKDIKKFFLIGIALLVVAFLNLFAAKNHLFFAYMGLGFFFTGFSLLESFLPSMVSRTAPIERKGTALGLYACMQFLGIFVGGIVGGFLYGHFPLHGVYIFCASLSLGWLAFSFFSPPPRYLTTQNYIVLPSYRLHWHSLKTRLQTIPGVYEVTYVPEQGRAYVKMESSVLNHQNFIQLTQEVFEAP